jgi:outer membrane protein assembly factor BamD (BamD/ComL family)
MFTNKNIGWLLGLGALLMTAFLALSLGCSGNKAADLFETAKLEELQNNPIHAIELYEEILRKYPKSEFAPKARQRLAVIKKE